MVAEASAGGARKKMALGASTHISDIGTALGSQRPSRNGPDEVHRWLPQGLEPASLLDLDGTTEVVPFPNGL
jgi:hypothetical protein